MEEIYVNVEYDKSVHSSPSTNQTGPRSSGRRCPGAVGLCLGLLSVFLLAGLIVLGVLYYNSARGAAAELSFKANLTELLQESKNKVSSLTEERDQLNARLNKTAEELNRLQNKTCPAEWLMFKFSCYFISHDSGSWKSGRQDCKDRDADLVVIDSAEEQKFLFGFITVETWIGLTDSEEEGTWKWVDGSSLTLRQWEKNQPDNFGGDKQWGEEDCAHIRGDRKKENNWNDQPCDASKHWICEKKLQQ